ncbi:hypothetical protein PTI98_006900 [Pleurotus ostreatus]|nr:hypothetical protein PTI98_006900 [Pleurotus ostreatus]
MVNFDSDEDGSANQSEPEFGYKLPPPPPPHTSPIELWRHEYAKHVAELKLAKQEKAELRSKLREKKKVEEVIL